MPLTQTPQQDLPNCPRCGYDLAGLAVQIPCPECGKRERGAGSIPQRIFARNSWWFISAYLLTIFILSAFMAWGPTEYGAPTGVGAGIAVIFLFALLVAGYVMTFRARESTLKLCWRAPCAAFLALVSIFMLLWMGWLAVAALRS